MERFTLSFIAVAIGAVILASMAFASRQAAGGAAPAYVTQIPAGYRDWKVISVAHEEGNLNSLGAILGNDVAIKAYRKESFLSLTAQSLPPCITVTRPLRRTTKSLGVTSLSFPGLRRTFSSWSKTRQNTPAREVGGSVTLTPTANPATRLS